ncbi:MAG: nucleotidyl transferase AbiEii/AbiGii toxin family protein [Pseudobdellovibrio sp.]
MISIDAVITISLTAIYSNDLLKDKLYLKGGQYLRMVAKIKNRFSVDTDFSTPNEIENEEIFFHALQEALSLEFYKNGFYLFSFKFSRKPKKRNSDIPDHWSGWAVEYKIIESSKRNLKQEELDRSAIIPDGAPNPKITLDISEYEFCGNTEKVKLAGSIEILSYSRVLVVLEKIRAICQQHPNYPLKKGNARSRDYYDIDILWNLALKEPGADPELFIQELKKYLRPVFEAKDVNLTLLKDIFEESFIESQKLGWPSVLETVSDKNIQGFDYYLENLKNIVNEIRT